MLRVTYRPLLALVIAACSGQPSPQHASWPDAVPLTPFERTAVGCYRVYGTAGGDSVITGWFPVDSILRLDASVLSVVVPPQGPSSREYVNEHPFWPRPLDFDTIWWVGHDGTLHLEWRTPRQSGRVHFYRGGGADLRASGDSLIGETREFGHVGRTSRQAIALKRLSRCPDGLESSPGAT